MEGIIRILRYTFYFVMRNNKMQIFHITLGKQTTENVIESLLTNISTDK